MVSSCKDAPLEHANARSVLKSVPGCNVCQPTGGTKVTRLLKNFSQFQGRVRPILPSVDGAHSVLVLRRALHPLGVIMARFNSCVDAQTKYPWGVGFSRALGELHSLRD